MPRSRPAAQIKAAVKPVVKAAAGSRPRAPRLPREERRELLLDATLRLLDRDGYRGASMEAIAREAGVAKPVVYNLFGDLGEVLRALLRREEARALDQLADALPRFPGDQRKDPDDLLVEGVQAFLEAVRSNPMAWRLILRPTEGTPDVVRQHVERNRARVAKQLQGVLTWGLEVRGGPQGLDVELAALAIIGLAEQTALLVLSEPEDFPPARISAFIKVMLGELQRTPRRA